MTIGEALSAAREEAGLDVDDLSRATKIRGQLIREIERDEYGGCGGAIYARGHIRALCNQLNLDPAPVVAEFDRINGAVEGPAAREIFEHEVIAEHNGRSGPNWTAAMAVAAALLLVVALGSLFTSKEPGGAAALDIIPQPTVTTPSPSGAVTPSTPSQPATDPVAFNDVRVILRIKPGEKSWVRASDSGRILFQGVLSNGAMKEFRAARELALVLGNAGAVTLVVNGRDLGSPGTSGQVVRTSFGPGDPSAANPG